VDVILDDRLLIEEILVGLDQARRGVPPALHTTNYWYYRACRAAVAGAGGWLSGPFEGLPASEQELAIVALLRLPSEIGLPDPRATVPIMAEVAARHPQLNLLNLEAVAYAKAIGATVWVSAPMADGVLPDVLQSERVSWTTVPV
jgi:hypothetical protein